MSNHPEKISLSEKQTSIHEHWSPKIIGALNGQHVKLAKLKGEFVWHQHEAEDELFYVIKGQLKILFRDHEVVLGPGELVIVPKGVEHKPVAEEEVEVMLFEPATTINTGDAPGTLTKEQLDWI